MPRRRFLQVFGGGVAGAMLATAPVGAATATPLASAPWTSLPAMRGAMHLHGSHSEGTASVGAHVAELDRTGFDFAFMTDHDWRRRAIGAFTDVPLDRMVQEGPNGGVWRWEAEELGDADLRRADIVTRDSALNQAATNQVLRVVVKARGEEPASHLLYANTAGNRDANRVNLTNQQIRLTLKPRMFGNWAYLVLRLALSYHAASGDRGPGYYFLDYRFGMREGDERAEAHHGIVWQLVEPDVWQEVTLDPVNDIARIWPDLVAEDNSLHGLWLGATAGHERKAVGEFAHLGITHGAQAGHEPTDVTRLNIDRQLSHQDSPLAMYVAEEMSLGGLHVNQYGSTLAVPVYPAELNHMGGRPTPSQMRAIIDEQIRPTDNLLSLNHVFGTAEGPPLPVAEQMTRISEVALDLMANGLFGVDIVEFGYNKRGNVDLAGHLHLMEILLRNGYIVTANGVSDDHGARAGSIDGINNPMATTLWTPTTGLSDILQATAEGQGFVSNIGRFAGVIDLQVDRFGPGSVVVDEGAARPLDKALLVHGSGLGKGYVEVVQGPVLAVTNDSTPLLDPARTVVARVDNTILNANSAPISIDVSASIYVYLRAYSVTRRGAVFLTAFTNPLWWLAHDPIPSGRVAPRRSINYL